MITKDTVFILGAGASDHYKYPMGAKLAEMIYTQMMSEKSQFVQDLAACDVEPGQQYMFARQLRDSNCSSIDEFLEHRDEEIEQLGRLAIARALIPLEIETDLRGGWYQYLWRAMSCPFDNLQNNRVSFLTFNYDRSLEQFLVNSAVNKYNVQPPDAAERIAQIPFYHLHGALSPLYRFRATDPASRPYSPQLHPSILRMAAGNIRVIHGRMSGNDPFEEALAVLRTIAPKNVIFLGFGFHRRNIDRLMINTWCGETRVYFSRYGFTNAEVEQIKGSLPPPVQFANLKELNPLYAFGTDKNHKCEDYLKEIGILPIN